MSATFEFIKTDAGRPKVTATRRYSRFAQEVLTFFAFHRTATAKHVQRSLPHQFRTDRCTRLHLGTLVANRDLAISRNSCTHPNVYGITRRGLRQLNIDAPSSQRRISASHLVHELLTTEIAVCVAEAARHRSDLAIPWEGRFDLTRHSVFGTLVPDYAFLFQHSLGSLVCCTEVFSGEESSTRIGDKLDNYASWIENASTCATLRELYQEHGANSPRATFRLLIVAHNRRFDDDLTRLAQVFGAVFQRLPSKHYGRVWGTTASELAAAGKVDAPIWIKARDLDSCADQYLGLPTRRRRPFLIDAVSQTSRHCLFPQTEESDVTEK